MPQYWQPGQWLLLPWQNSDALCAECSSCIRAACSGAACFAGEMPVRKTLGTRCANFKRRLMLYICRCQLPIAEVCCACGFIWLSRSRTS